MAEYLVSARKYRPALFAEVIGQDHITHTLENAITQSRIAQAYLFAGPRGVGKTTTARILSKALNCDQGISISPCNQCKTCRQVTDGLSLDVLEIDGASNRGIDEIRSLQENINYFPGVGKYKIYIIDEVHMLTEHAFNALLKTLEEPPPRVIFIFATTEPHRIPLTILSRCQRYDFRRIPHAMITDQINRIAKQEGISISTESLNLITRKAEGSMRDAESLFDQVSSFCGQEVTPLQVENLLGITGNERFYQLIDAIPKKEFYTGLYLINQLLYSGHDIVEFLYGLIEFIRNLIILKLESKPDQIFGIAPDDIPRLQTLATQFPILDLYRMINLISRYESVIKFSGRNTVQLEMLIFKLFSFNSLETIESIITQIKKAEPMASITPSTHAIRKTMLSPVPASPAASLSASALSEYPAVPAEPEVKEVPEVPMIQKVMAASVAPVIPGGCATLPSSGLAEPSNPSSFSSNSHSSIQPEPSPTLITCASQNKPVGPVDSASTPSSVTSQSIWQQVITQISIDQNVVSDYLAEAELVSLDQGTLNLRIPESTERMKTMLEKPEAYCRIQAEWLKFSGQTIKLHYEFNMLDKSKFEQEFKKEIPVIEIKTRSLDDYKNEYPVITYLQDKFKAEISDKNKPKPGRRKRDE